MIVIGFAAFERWEDFYMRRQIKGQTFDEERALYNLCSCDVVDCVFAGPADGESVLKETRDIGVYGCSFSLRYPLWHANGFLLSGSELDELTRAPIWYSSNGRIENCRIKGVKCLRECNNIDIQASDIVSPEFGWKCRSLRITDSVMDSEYFLFESEDVDIKGLRMSGKYSFQYMNNVRIRNSVMDTKDAFWHSKDVVVEDSVLNGEYLGWFSDGLTLRNCRINGTQPLCYCKNLVLENCIMENTDLAFEYSDVEADVKGNILSVKNPKSGHITADSIGEIILEGSVMDTNCEIKERTPRSRS